MRNNALCKTGRELSIHTKMGVYFLHSHSSRMCSNQYSLTTLAIIQSEDSRHLNFQMYFQVLLTLTCGVFIRGCKTFLQGSTYHFFLCSYFIVL